MDQLDIDRENKLLYARSLIEYPDDPLKAGFVAFKNNAQLAMLASMQWLTDEVVCNEVKRLRGVEEEEAEVLLPSKSRHCQMLYEIFEDSSHGVKDRLLASDQITRMQGFIIDKKEINSTINNKIMLVTRSLSDDDWEKKAMEQQARLMG